MCVIDYSIVYDQAALCIDSVFAALTLLCLQVIVYVKFYHSGTRTKMSIYPSRDQDQKVIKGYSGLQQIL